MDAAFAYKRDSNGITVVGELRSPDGLEVFLERQRSRAPRELRFRVIFAALARARSSLPTRTCLLYLAGQFQEVDELRIEMPEGEDVVLSLKAA